MTTWDVGDRVPLRHKVYDTSGALSDATVTLTVYAPDDTTSTPSVTHASTGVYDATVLADQAGHYRYRWDASGVVPVDVTWGGFDAADPAPPLYVDLDTFRSSLDRADTDTSRDSYLYACLAAASRGIDEYCGRTFYRDAAATARTYRTRGRVDATDDDGELLLLDDIATTTDLEVETGDVDFTDLDDDGYEVEPANALVKRKPITGMRRVGGCWSTVRRVRVTAIWGWPAVPAQVAQATQMQAARLYKRRQSPEGVVGNSEWGVVRLSRIDPDVQALLAPFVLQVIG